MKQSIRLIFADDHRLIRAAIRAFLFAEMDIEVVGEAVNGHEALQCSRQLKPDVLLLDLRMPGPPATQIVTTLATDRPKTRVVILSANDDPHTIAHLLVAGIAGYVLKDDVAEELVDAVHAVAHGARYYSRTILRKYATLLHKMG